MLLALTTTMLTPALASAAPAQSTAWDAIQQGLTQRFDQLSPPTQVWVQAQRDRLTAAEPYAVQVARLELTGFESGIQGLEPQRSERPVYPDLEGAAVDLNQLEAGLFLFWIESGQIGSRGRLNDVGQAAADSFLAGAAELFPNAEARKPP